MHKYMKQRINKVISSFLRLHSKALQYIISNLMFASGKNSHIHTETSTLFFGYKQTNKHSSIQVKYSA